VDLVGVLVLPHPRATYCQQNPAFAAVESRDVVYDVRVGQRVVRM
jgi:hypothetical protein